MPRMHHFASFTPRASVGLQRPTNEPLTIKINSRIDVHISLRELVTPISPQLGLASSILVVSTKCIEPWVLEFMVSNITCNNQWENCISLDFDFRGLCEPRNP